MPDGAEALDLFVADGSERIARLAVSSTAAGLPEALRPAAASVMRQAAGGWSVTVRDEAGFFVRSAMRQLDIGRGFGGQCERVLQTLSGSVNPEIRRCLAALDSTTGGSRQAVMSAFFHYFCAHEFLHIEQGLGSDQYKDSDAYLPIVAEADYLADVAGLAIVSSLTIPELTPLDARSRTLLLVAIHLAAMHSFADEGAPVSSHDFFRLLVWYLHFARIAKSEVAPDLASATMLRPWTIAVPRLIGRSDLTLTADSLRERATNPYPAGSDLVVAYHQEDGLYRIHRAALTDPKRTLRLCHAILAGAFDEVRTELEELLVNNPALVPSDRRAPAVEWSAGEVISLLERLPDAADGQTSAHVSALRRSFDQFRSALRRAGAQSPATLALADQGDQELDLLEADLKGRLGTALAPRRRRLLSLVDQLVLDAT